ncbi:hypothetical protein AVEN_14434-1, partial [Araneus ventricosus]
MDENVPCNIVQRYETEMQDFSRQFLPSVCYSPGKLNGTNWCLRKKITKA